MTNYTRVLEDLYEGRVDEKAWREVAEAAPSAFHLWANAFPALQRDSILVGCRKDHNFRRNYDGDRTVLNRHTEEYYERFISEDFGCPECIPPFRTRRAATQMIKNMITPYGQHARPDYNLAMRLAQKWPDLQATATIHCATALNEADPVPKEVIEEYLCSVSSYNHKMIKSLFTCRELDEIRSWRLPKFECPQLAFIFGTTGQAKIWLANDRRFAYLSVFNVRNDDWASVFKEWLNRHEKYDMSALDMVESRPITRDFGQLSDAFFTERRTAVLNQFVRHLRGVKITMPSELNIRLREQILAGNFDGYRYLKEAILGG